MRAIHPDHYYRNFLHPKYWGTWCIIAVLFLISLLPYTIKLEVGKGLGRLLYKIGGNRLNIARCNIRACFPELNIEQQEQLVRQTFISNAIGYVENTIAWFGNMQPYLSKLEIHGKEHLEAAIAKGQGVLLVGGHFSILDFAGPLAHHVNTFNYMYRPQNNPLLNAMVERSRRAYSKRSFTQREIKDMIAYIQEGNVVWYGMDQDLKKGVFAPFFGIPAATLTTPSWIAKETGCSIVQISQFREKEKGVYSVHYTPIYSSIPSGDDIQDATLLNKGLEEAIRTHPDQYLWLHKRFKTRPEGEASLYGDKKANRIKQ